MEFKKSLIISIFLLILSAVFSGCGSDNIITITPTPVPTSAPQWTFDGSSINYFSQALNYLKNEPAKDRQKAFVSDVVIGVLLELLMSDKKDDQILKDIASANKTLIDVKDQVTAANTALNELSGKLDMQFNAILISIEESTIKSAVDTITVHYERNNPDSLYYFTTMDPNKITDTDKREINKFSDNVIDNWNIKTHITSINSAICKDDGLLDVFTDKLILKYKNKPEKAEDCYKALEKYFTRLLYLQLEGVDLYVEALNISMQDNHYSAKDYINKTFIGYMDNEIAKFKKCTEKLMINLSSVDTGTYVSDINSGQPFVLDPLTPAIGRANFMCNQLAGNNSYGLKGLVITTEDYSPYANNINITGGGNPGTVKRENVSGPIYGSWENSLNLKPSSNWVTYEVDFGNASFSAGSTYDVSIALPDGSFKKITTVTINQYDGNYNQGQGNIPYGYFVLIWRWGNNQFDKVNNSKWNVGKEINVSSEVSSFSSNPDQNGNWQNRSPLSIVLNTKYINPDYGSSQTYDATLEISRNFVFKGNSDISGSVFYTNINASGRCKRNSSSWVEGMPPGAVSYVLFVYDTTSVEYFNMVSKANPGTWSEDNFSDNIPSGSLNVTFKANHNYCIVGKVIHKLTTFHEYENQVKLDWGNLQIVF